MAISLPYSKIFVKYNLYQIRWAYPDVIEQVEKELPNIRLEFLPAYSPDYHLIELVWHSAKEYIANREFENKEELEKVVNQLLNEGGLIIKWSRKLKNKGNAVNVT